MRVGRIIRTDHRRCSDKNWEVTIRRTYAAGNSMAPIRDQPACARSRASASTSCTRCGLPVSTVAYFHSPASSWFKNSSKVTVGSPPLLRMKISPTQRDSRPIRATKHGRVSR